ncbi:hypothetical protein BJ322DRAFT_817690 [Thelephora terrestris]|uniref:Nephrocystin 3-like N-terminal domain-containing protein n=1 Tax=Thelephora terrestris TaxID=56493 RepID=A0A9P6HFN5_9AGAM|nr:hypothetical protein BJ322DRAFT_817690 [Thelephora terrestris]
MRHLLKGRSSSTRPMSSPPPKPTPPVVQPIKQGVKILNPKVTDIRLLPALANTIALAIASPSCGSSNPALDEPGSSKESSWKAVYEPLKLAIDVANASSDMCLPLKAVVGALSVLVRNYDQTTDNADQIKEIERRVVSLGDIFESPVGDQDDEEKARRDALRKKLTCVITKLGPLSEQGDIKKFLNNADNAKTLNGIVQDLATAVIDYQTSLQQDIYGSTKKIGEVTQNIHKNTENISQDIQGFKEAADLEWLEKLGPVRNAGYQAGHHDPCLPGTRESVLDWIMQWANNPQERHVFWLNGLAGTGKSTIAQTFSRMVAEAGFLGASFFCSRDYLDRKELKNIFPTLAYQLACHYPAFQNEIIKTSSLTPSPLLVLRASLLWTLWTSASTTNPPRPSSPSLVVMARTYHRSSSSSPGGQSLAFGPDSGSLSWNQSLKYSCCTRSNCPMLTKISGCSSRRSLLRWRDEEVTLMSLTHGPAIRTSQLSPKSHQASSFLRLPLPDLSNRNITSLTSVFSSSSTSQTARPMRG